MAKVKNEAEAAAGPSNTTPEHSSIDTDNEGSNAAERTPKKGEKRKKVGMACIYCRRSHMTCDDGRPCKRCIKRDIGHLCHDETPTKPSVPSATKRRQHSMTATPPVASNEGNHDLSQHQRRRVQQIPPAASMANVTEPGHGQNAYPNAPPQIMLPPEILSAAMLQRHQPQQEPGQGSGWAANMLGGASFLGLGGGDVGGNNEFAASGDAAGGPEYNILSEFLESLDGTSAMPTPSAIGQAAPTDVNVGQTNDTTATDGPAHNRSAEASHAPADSTLSRSNHKANLSAAADAMTKLTSNSKADTFFLTAADQNDGTRDERLGKVIQAKLDAGLLRPYNHVKGYARLNSWMEQNCTQASRRRILKPLSIFRPAFRAVAQRLTNVDLIFIEEAFERLLLDYDRVFSTQGIPACLWRRTGEIYKGNKEFADLVGVPFDALRDGHCTVYELMQEESAVNYWEKYGAVCFDPGQKAVLTSCILRKARERSLPARNAQQHVRASNGSKAGKSGAAKNSSAIQESTALTNCCFSFTIRRDAWGIPYAIIGNFLPLSSSSAATTTAQ